MSDLMRLIPYRQLLNWTLTEYREKGSIFGVSKIVRRDGDRFPIFDGGIQTVFGPAAGPNTQLAQNLIASYAAGASWFELKTVQKMDGRELAACVPKPQFAWRLRSMPSRPSISSAMAWKQLSSMCVPPSAFTAITFPDSWHSDLRNTANPI